MIGFSKMELQRIVVVHDRIDARGGATGLARLSAIQYQKLGYDVVYLTGSKDDQSLEEFGIETFSLGQSTLASSAGKSNIIKGLHNSDAALRIANWIAENDAPGTAYHLHNWAQALSPSVFSALRPVANRTVVSCHDFFNVCPNGGLVNFQTKSACSLKPMSVSCWGSQCDRRNRAQKMWRMLRQLNLQRVARFKSSEMTFVCLHEGMEVLMREAGFAAKNLTHIANPATPYCTTRIAAESNSQFLYIGRLTEEKGVDILVEAARKSKTEVAFAGEGPLREKLEPLYDGATFHGFCNREKLIDLAKSARALIVPGRWREPYGLVVAEAAQSGLPVIISDPSTLAEQVRKLNFGVVFDPSHPAQLTSILADFSDDNALVESLSHSAYDSSHLISNTPESWASQFVDLIKEKLNLARP